ncbi:hypothetical protein WJX77_004781 [Trebouxia sp. C0004]
MEVRPNGRKEAIEFVWRQPDAALTLSQKQSITAALAKDTDATATLYFLAPLSEQWVGTLKGLLEPTGISGATASVDDSIGVMQALFAPFSETAFPKSLNATSLAGQTRYIIMIATAGECISVFALDVRQGAQLQPLVEQFEMRTLSGRRKVLQLFINLTRWLHTVHSLDLLPPPPPARLMKAFFRPSPYHVNSNEEQYGIPAPYDVQACMSMM